MHSPTGFDFGPRLKAQRERRGLSLQVLSDSTKISLAMFAGLERNDVSQWPKGIFRRAFLRSYTDAVGLPFEPVWVEFTALFPEDGSPSRVRPFAQGTGPLRLTLASGARDAVRVSPHQATAAAADLAVIVVFAALLTWTTGWSVWTIAAVVATVYGAASTLLLGRSLSLWLLDRTQARPGTEPQAHEPQVATPAPPPAPRPIAQPMPDADDEPRLVLDAIPLSLDVPAHSRRPRRMPVAQPPSKPTTPTRTQ